MYLVVREIIFNLLLFYWIFTNAPPQIGKQFIIHFRKKKLGLRLGQSKLNVKLAPGQVCARPGNILSIFHCICFTKGGVLFKREIKSNESNEIGIHLFGVFI